MQDKYGTHIPEEIKCNVRWVDDKPTYVGPRDKHKLKLFKQYERKALGNREFTEQKLDTTRNVLKTCYSSWDKCTKYNILKCSADDVTYEDMIQATLAYIRHRSLKTGKYKDFYVFGMFQKILEDKAMRAKLVTYTGTKTDKLYKSRYTGLIKFAVWSLKHGILTLDMPKYGYTISLRARYADVGFLAMTDTKVYNTVKVNNAASDWVQHFIGYDKFSKFCGMSAEEYANTDMCRNVVTKKRLIVDFMVNCQEVVIIDVLNNVAFSNMTTVVENVGVGFENDCGYCKRSDGAIATSRGRVESDLCLLRLDREPFPDCCRYRCFHMLPLVDDILNILFDLDSGKQSVSEVREAMKNVDMDFFKAEVRERDTEESMIIDYATVNVIEGDTYCNMLDFKEQGRTMGMSVPDDLLEKSEREIIEYALMKCGEADEVGVS